MCLVYYLVGSALAFFLGVWAGVHLMDSRFNKLAKKYEKLFGALQQFFEAGYKEGRRKKQGCKNAYEEFQRHLNKVLEEENETI